MTACAMTAGMVPMALALERGSEMQAPLGRAVIGGLVMSTFATLLVVPSIFAIVIGRKKALSPSFYPADPESKHYDAETFAHRDEASGEGARTADEPLPPHPKSDRRNPVGGDAPGAGRTGSQEGPYLQGES
jgi:hypothetical protein